jgi:hypothetical protein
MPLFQATIQAATARVPWPLADRSAASVVSIFTLTAWRTAASLWYVLRSRHPGWRTSAPLAQSVRETFQHDYRFANPFPLLAEIGEHLHNVHLGSIAQCYCFGTAAVPKLATDPFNVWVDASNRSARPLAIASIRPGVLWRKQRFIHGGPTRTTAKSCGSSQPIKPGGLSR